MKALVVYESHWGNTAAVARAIAEGLGGDAKALPTDEASGPVLDELDLLVAGAPVMAFGLPSDKFREGMERDTKGRPADLSHPLLRTWLGELPRGHGRAAAFETAFRWSPGSATGAISKELDAAGYAPLSKSRRFVVTGTQGPLREGELDRARAWGAELAGRMKPA